MAMLSFVTILQLGFLLPLDVAGRLASRPFHVAISSPEPARHSSVFSTLILVAYNVAIDVCNPCENHISISAPKSYFH